MVLPLGLDFRVPRPLVAAGVLIQQFAAAGAVPFDVEAELRCAVALKAPMNDIPNLRSFAIVPVMTASVDV
jgi:hypothetical protein